MTDNDQVLESAVQDLIVRICEVMSAHGFERVSMSALMELLGVPENKARVYRGRYVDFATDLDTELKHTRERDLLMAHSPSKAIH